MGTNRAPATGSILVYIRGEDGKPFSAIPQITLTVEENNQAILQTPRMTGNAWAFSSLATGMTYEVDVAVEGYQRARQAVLIPDIDGASASVMIFMRPVNGGVAFRPPTGQFLLAPRAQKEVAQGLRDVQSNKIASAQKHFEKALKMAPGNPYVNYVMGISYLLAKQLTSARPYLEESVSVDPNQAASLLALGTLRFEQADYPEAIEVLSKGVQLDSSSWKSQWLLSASYLHQRNFTEARDHAKAALTAGKGQASQVEIILAGALAGLGDREGALRALGSFLNAHPNDPMAPKIRVWTEELRKPVVTPQTSTVVNVAQQHSGAAEQPATDAGSVSLTPSAVAELPPKKNWAPPDIDDTEPFVIPEATCFLPKVLKAAQKRAVQFVDTLQKFTATEEYQSVEIKRNESLEKPESRTYSYVAVVESKPGVVVVTEYRNQSASEQEMPGKLNDIGAPALALVFHPVYEDDFSWSCEGLGEWRDKTAWVVRFEQRLDRPDRMAAFQAQSARYPLPFKGRAWILENGQVIHADFDLVKPIPQVRLDREHFSIEYQPVTFKSHKITLWLPENVDIYYQYRGYYLHHYHHFSNFELFWTGATEKVSPPTDTSKRKND